MFRAFCHVTKISDRSCQQFKCLRKSLEMEKPRNGYKNSESSCWVTVQFSVCIHPVPPHPCANFIPSTHHPSHYLGHHIVVYTTARGSPHTSKCAFWAEAVALQSWFHQIAPRFTRALPKMPNVKTTGPPPQGQEVHFILQEKKHVKFKTRFIFSLFYVLSDSSRTSALAYLSELRLVNWVKGSRKE